MSRLGTAFAALAILAIPAGASAAPVLRMNQGGEVTAVVDPYLSPTDPLTAGGGPVAGAAAARAHGPARGKPTVFGTLSALRAAHGLSAAHAHADANEVRAAVAAARRLGGTRGLEINGVLDDLRTIAADRQLTAGRLPALMLTLRRNREWWSTGPLLSVGQRVEFAGSQLVWEHYAYQGIQLQELGSFGKANGLYDAHEPNHLRALLSELIPLAVPRAGGIAWEYFFTFESAPPPWTSAMSQATAIEALSRAYRASHDANYLRIARRALPLLAARPPTGVSVTTRLGRRFLIYSFAPGEAVINAFLQTLIGLKEFIGVSDDGRASRLFAQGNREALAELPHYDTGRWSLYEPGQLDTLDYHELVTGFLQNLCQLTSIGEYCTYARKFTDYLRNPPPLP